MTSTGQQVLAAYLTAEAVAFRTRRLRRLHRLRQSGHAGPHKIFIAHPMAHIHTRAVDCDGQFNAVQPARSICNNHAFGTHR